MSSRSFSYFDITPPTKWQAGRAGFDMHPIYFDCADCGAHEPAIAGIIAATDNPTFTGIATFKAPDGFYKTAMFCAPCYAARLAISIQEETR